MSVVNTLVAPVEIAPAPSAPVAPTVERTEEEKKARRAAKRLRLEQQAKAKAERDAQEQAAKALQNFGFSFATGSLLAEAKGLSFANPEKGAAAVAGAKQALFIRAGAASLKGGIDAAQGNELVKALKPVILAQASKFDF